MKGVLNKDSYIFAYETTSILEVSEMIVNLTPHDINIVDATGTVVFRTLPSQGIARAAQYTEVVGTVDGIRLTRSVYGDPVGLPDPVDGTYLVVSLATVFAAKRSGRTVADLLVTNEAVRDTSGCIVGCQSLATVY